MMHPRQVHYRHVVRSRYGREPVSLRFQGQGYRRRNEKEGALQMLRMSVRCTTYRLASFPQILQKVLALYRHPHRSSLAFIRGRDSVEPIRPVVQTLGDPRLVLAVSDVIEHWAHRPVYRKLQRNK